MEKTTVIKFSFGCEFYKESVLEKNLNMKFFSFLKIYKIYFQS
jgi:hypothetical protein